MPRRKAQSPKGRVRRRKFRQSACIAATSIEYLSPRMGKVSVEFTDGKGYELQRPMRIAVWEEWGRSRSPGKYWNRHLRGRYSKPPGACSPLSAERGIPLNA